MALQSWAVAHAVLTFAAAAFKEGSTDPYLKDGLMKGALAVTEKPYLTVHNEQASDNIIDSVLECCRTGGIDYFKWIKQLGTVEVCSRQVEADDFGASSLRRCATPW